MELLPEFKSAATDGRVGKMKRLLCGGVSPDVADERGRSTLHWAAERGQSRVARLLVDAGAQIDLRDKSGATALHLACMHGHKDVVKLLLDSEADTVMTTNSSSSALHLATQNGHLEVVQLLIGQSDCDQQLRDGSTPTQLAAQLGHLRVLKKLLRSANADVRNELGQSPMHCAALHGQQEAIELLVRTGVDATSLALDASSPLHAAAAMGHEAAVVSLLRHGCSLSLLNSDGLSPAALACRFGHKSSIQLLTKHETDARKLRIHDSLLTAELQQIGDSQRSANTGVELRMPTQQWTAEADPDDDRSEQDIMNQALLPVVEERNPADQIEAELLQTNDRLSEDLKKSGFQLDRVKLVAASSDVLQSILRRRMNVDEYLDHQVYIVGSFSEGWSNSLVCLDGQTDRDSDIDVCLIGAGMLFHLKGFCRCINCTFDGERNVEVEYENGHVKWAGAPSNPSQSWSGSDQRPAVDLVWALRCCCYPRIEVLERGQRTHINPVLLKDLRQEMKVHPCHLVAAAPPGEDGQQLRVSTTFLERKLLRNLTTEQGQVFVVIKFIIKKVIAKRSQGLKTYIAKTLMFYLLDETPAQNWKSEGLMALVRKALRQLSTCLSNSEADACMKHFFLRDAWVYLKAHHDSKEAIAKVVSDVTESLPAILKRFRIKLRPLDDVKALHFHPFLILPILDPRPVPMSSTVQFHDVYDAIRSMIIWLADGSCSEADQEPMLRLARRIPDYARSTKNCIMSLIYLKFGRRYAARRVLRSCRYHEVSRQVANWMFKQTDAESELALCEHLEQVNSVWKLLIQTDKPPVLDFLPSRIRQIFPLASSQFNWYYINFDALLKCLSLWMDYNAELDLWFERILRSSSPDAQELLVTLEFCQDRDLLVRLIHRHRRAICDHKDVRHRAEYLMSKDPSLTDDSIKEAVRATKKSLFNGSDDNLEEPANPRLVQLFYTCCALSLLILLTRKARRLGWSIGTVLLAAAERTKSDGRRRGSVLSRHSFAWTMTVSTCVLYICLIVLFVSLFSALWFININDPKLYFALFAFLTIVIVTFTIVCCICRSAQKDMNRAVKSTEVLIFV